MYGTGPPGLWLYAGISLYVRPGPSRRFNLLMMSQLDTPNGPLNTYQLRPGCNLIPFLYFGAELMRSLGHYSLIFPARRTALMRGALGENSLSPHWITTAHQEENQLPYGKYGMD